MNSDAVINFRITLEQAEKICSYFGKNLIELEDYEVCGLLDKLIDSIVDTGEIAPLNF